MGVNRLANTILRKPPPHEENHQPAKKPPIREEKSFMFEKL